MKKTDSMHDRRVALADANNFFVSCERRVSPDLTGRPVVVLSSNDGCVVSRSNEVKAMGIRMGEPYFKVRNILAYHGVTVRSSNMKLYKDVSREVISLIGRYTDSQEVYSIDECFFNMAIASVSDPLEYCRTLISKVWDNCRIPISIGIAPTKTLAKLASEYAKKHENLQGVFWLDALKYKDTAFMEQFPCRDIWGIGAKLSNDLSLRGIKNAAQMANKDDLWIKNLYGINGLNCVWELRGTPVHTLSSLRKIKKSIMVSRSFGKDAVSYQEVLDPLLCFAVSAAYELRKARMAAGKIKIFIMTDRFLSGYYEGTREHVFKEPKTLDTDFINAAKLLLRQIYVSGKNYKKCGVILSDLTDVSMGKQTSLFSCEDDEKKEKVAETFDKINKILGYSVIKPALLYNAPGEEKKWKSKADFKSDTKNKVQETEDLRFESHADDFA